MNTNRFSRFLLLATTAQALALSAATPAAAATAWDSLRAGNPVIPGYFADPCSRKFGDTYYLYVTPDGWDVGRGPAGVWTSKDYVNWTWHSMNWPQTEFKWAPSVIKSKDKYYMFSSVPCQIWAASADSPLGPWANLMGADGKEMIPDQTPKGTIVLDAEAFVDDDQAQSTYLWYSTWWRPTVAKLKPDMRSFDGEPIQYFKHEGLQNPPKGLVTGCMEAPYMFKRKGIYYLMYSDAMCQDSTYNVKYSTSKSPTGPFEYDLAKNPILETTDDGTVDGPGHHSLLVEGAKVYIVYHRHDNPHDPDGAHRQTCISELYFNEDGSIEKVQPGHLGVGYLAPSTKRDTNLALGKTVTASSFLSSDFRPEYALDQNNGTLWKAGDKTYPQWLQVDLGKTSPVRRVETEFQYPQVANRYLIEYSDDATIWQTFAERKQNKEPGVMIDQAAVQARYVRITLLGQDSGRPDQWASLWAFRVYDGIDKPNQAPLVDLGPTLNLNFRYPSFSVEAGVSDDGLPNGPVTLAWSKVSGPGTVSFTHPERARTDVKVNKAGTYVLKLTADDGSLKGEQTLTVNLPVPTERVIAYDFDEVSGAVVTDGSDNGKYGVLRKGATRSMGMRGRAANLDGADDHLSISPIGELQRATITAWINPHNVRPDSSLLCTDGSGPGSLKLVLNSNGAVQVGIEGLAPLTSEFRFTAEQAGEWRHVAVTYDPEAKSAAFYIDGKLDVTRVLPEAPVLKFSRPARIGSADAGARGFSGEVDEFRLYEKVLSVSEIAGLAKREVFVSIAAAKEFKDGATVVLMSKPVTLAAADPLSLERSTDFFYVSDLDGQSGIRIEDGKTGQDKSRADVCVSLTGTLKTKPSGERYVELTSPPTTGASRGAPPSLAEISTLAGTVGRLVRLEGTVKEVSSDAKWFTMTDASGTAPVKVLTRQFAPMKKIEAGNKVAVTGVVGYEADGAQVAVLIRSLTRISPLASDALAFYSFDEDGDIAKDSSPGKQDGKLVNSSSRTSGKLGKAMQLDGEKSYLQVPDLGMQTAVTAALWLNLTDFAKDEFSSVLHCDGWSWGCIHWNVGRENKKLNVHLNGIGELHSRFEFTPDKLGQWVHVALTYDAKARAIKLYVNGQEEAAAGAEAPRAVDLTHVKVGCWDGRARMWKGTMDEVRFYDRALSPAEIAGLAGGKP
jgi:uncharacterized protein YdeI (BOF family)